jgi:hypothetical protein
MQKQNRISVLFYLSAIYDGILGVAFLVAAPAIFAWSQVTPPNHWGYVQFPGALLIIFALMFLAVAKNPVENRGLICYGILLKIAYCAIVFYYWIVSGLPDIWKPWAIADLVFLTLFIWAYRKLGAAAAKK